MALSISVANDNGTRTLALAGEVDLQVVDDLRQAIAEAISSGTNRVVIDLADLEFLDSSGISALIYAKRTADQHNVAFEVINPKDRVDDILTLAQVMDYLNGEAPI